MGTIAQIAKATRGRALANFPASPRKYRIDTPGVDRCLRVFFTEVDRIEAEDAAPVWSLVLAWTHGFSFTPEEIAAANVRPAGAVGGDPVVVRIVARLLHLAL